MAWTELLESAGRRGRDLVLLSALILGASSPPSAWAAPSSSVEVLESFAEEAGGLDVVVDRCHSHASSNDLAMADCPMRVRLLDRAKVVDTVTFGAKACGAPSRDGEARRLGVPSGVQIWSTSAPGCAVAVAVESVRVAPEVTGVLVSQAEGTKSAVRRHWLFVEKGGKVFLSWSSDQEGEAGSDLTVQPVPTALERFDDLIVIREAAAAGGTGGTGGVAAQVSARRLRWNPMTARVLTYAMPSDGYPLYLAYLGPLETAVAARNAGGQRPPTCQIPGGIFPATLFPGLALSGYLRAEVLGSAVEARDRLSRAKAGKCPATLIPKVIEYVPRVEYSARHGNGQ